MLGVTVSVAGYVMGTISLPGVGLNLALLGFVTAVYLSIVVRDRRRPQDLIAVFGYLLYAAGFGFLSAPSHFAFGELTPPARALGALFLGLLLPLTWFLFVEYLID